MKKTLALILASILALLPALAGAQTFPTIPSQTVIGRTAIGAGPAQAIPFTQLSAQFCSNFTLTLKGCVPPPGTTTGRYLSDDIVTPWKAVPTQAVTAGTGVSLGGVCSGTALNCQVSATAATQYVLPSRAAAAGSDLSALSSVRTLGYTAPGDGGDALFQKIATNFVDTRILTGNITAAGTSGCTNGSYFGVAFTGGNGRGAYAQVTVSGNIVTSVTMGGASTAGYAAGDVLSATVTGCATTVTWTVSTVSTPTGSFTDTAGNKWQIVFPAAGLDARAMGVKFDWDGVDGSATDNWTTLQNALSFAYNMTTTIVDLGGSIGGQVLLPKTTAMFCGGGATPIVVPGGVKVKGQGNYSSVLKPCDTWNVAANVIELCDKNTHNACFGALLEDLQIFMQRDVTSNIGVSLVYTNNAQHEAGLRRVVLYPGACRRAVTYEQGYGGATYIVLESVEAKGGKGSASCGGANGMVVIAFGTTQVRIKDLVMGGLSATFNGPRDNGLIITGGFVNIDGFHSEQIISPATINIVGGLANGMVRVFNAIGGVDCVGLFTLISTNTLGNFMLSPPMALNGCARLVTNGQPAGANLVGPVMIDTIFNP